MDVTQERAPQPSPRGDPATQPPSSQLSTPGGGHPCVSELLQSPQVMLIGCDQYGLSHLPPSQSPGMPGGCDTLIGQA